MRIWSMPVLGSFPRIVILFGPARNGKIRGLMAGRLVGGGRGNPARPVTADHCQALVPGTRGASKMSSLPPATETRNAPFAEAAERTLHQMMQLLGNGKSTEKVAAPDQASGVAIHCPPDASGSRTFAIGNCSFPDSASSGR